MSQNLIDQLPNAQWHSPAIWAIDNIKIDGLDFTLHDYPFLLELYLNAHLEEIVVRKAAQLGYTTWAIISTLWYLKNPLFHTNALYIFPTKELVYDFSSGRLDTIIKDSKAFSEDDAMEVDNKGLKKIGRRNLYFRGTTSQAGLVEIPAPWQVLDEIDKFKIDGVVSLARKRAGGARAKFFKYLSNPTLPDTGIDHLYLNSSQGEWQNHCDHCNRWQTLDFFKNLDIDNPDRGVFCRWCKKPLNRLGPGRWLHKRDHHRKGYWVSQLNSPTVTPLELIREYLACQGEIDMMNFYNMGLGLPYVPKGGKLTEAELLRAISTEYQRGTRGEGEHFMGIDVGSHLDWVIIDSNDNIRDWGAVKNPDDISRLIQEWDIFFFVIDAQPESRLSMDLCREFPGRGAICYYKENKADKDLEDFVKQFNRNREIELDHMYHAIRSRKHRFPEELKQDQDFKDHLCNLIKVTQEDSKGNNKIVKFMRYGKPDHKAHGLNYARIAKESFQPPRLRHI